jgi:integrase
MPYSTEKGLPHAKVEKTNRQKYLTLDQLRKVLQTIEESDQPKKERDHCAVYLGYFFGLRVSEVCILERETFRHISEHQAYIRTSKSIPRIPVVCKCGRKWRVSATKIKQTVLCPRCSAINTVKAPRRPVDPNPPEKQPPVIETPVVAYVQKYMDGPACGERWFLESKRGKHIGTRQMERIFGHYCMAAGIGPEYSFHALRHGRGLLIYERFKDPVMLRDMLRQATLSAAEWYMHLSPERQREYLEVLDGAADFS